MLLLTSLEAPWNGVVVVSRGVVDASQEELCRRSCSLKNKSTGFLKTIKRWFWNAGGMKKTFNWSITRCMKSPVTNWTPDLLFCFCLFLMTFRTASSQQKSSQCTHTRSPKTKIKCSIENRAPRFSGKPNGSGKLSQTQKVLNNLFLRHREFRKRQMVQGDEKLKPPTNG